MSNEYHLPSDPRDYLAHIREIDSGVYGNATQNLPRGVIPVRRGRSFNQHLSSNNVIAVSNIPFLIMPGDGAANGCQFTGSGGAFTLSAAIQANIGAILAGCYAYFSAGFGGSSLPAGWYWTEFSSDTAGIVYAETYTSGNVTRPTTKTSLTPNLSGWVTGTTNEVVGPDGFILPAGCLGKNGSLMQRASMAGSTSSEKRFNSKIGSNYVFRLCPTTSPVGDSMFVMSCKDSHTEKFCGRSGISGVTGYGIFNNGISTAWTFSVNTSVDVTLSYTLQQLASTAGVIVTRFDAVATYGE